MVCDRTSRLYRTVPVIHTNRFKENVDKEPKWEHQTYHYFLTSRLNCSCSIFRTFVVIRYSWFYFSAWRLLRQCFKTGETNLRLPQVVLCNLQQLLWLMCMCTIAINHLGSWVYHWLLCLHVRSASQPTVMVVAVCQKKLDTAVLKHPAIRSLSIILHCHQYSLTRHRSDVSLC